jgi:hypothetical protein
MNRTSRGGGTCALIAKSVTTVSSIRGRKYEKSAGVVVDLSILTHNRLRGCVMWGWGNRRRRRPAAISSPGRIIHITASVWFRRGASAAQQPGAFRYGIDFTGQFVVGYAEPANCE